MVIFVLICLVFLFMGLWISCNLGLDSVWMWCIIGVLGLVCRLLVLFLDSSYFVIVYVSVVLFVLCGLVSS